MPAIVPSTATSQVAAPVREAADPALLKRRLLEMIVRNEAQRKAVAR